MNDHADTLRYLREHHIHPNTRFSEALDAAIAALEAGRSAEPVAYIERYKDGYGRDCTALVWGDHPHNTPGRTFTPLYDHPQQPPPVGVMDAWRPINELPDSDDLFWFRRRDNIDGPSTPQRGGFDADEYDYFAPCEPPSLSHQQPAPSEFPADALFRDGADGMIIHSVDGRFVHDTYRGGERVSRTTFQAGPPCDHEWSINSVGATVCDRCGELADNAGIPPHDYGFAAPVSKPAYTKADDLLHTIGSVEHQDAASGEGLAELPKAALEWSDTLCDGERVDHATAEKACAALGEGWRLPTREELESILALDRYDPAIDETRFPGTKSGAYWTSTPCAWSSNVAWIVYFLNGYVGNFLRDYDLAFVRAVRSVPATRLSTDATTGQGDVERLVEAVRKAHELLASIGPPANEFVAHDNLGEWTFMGAMPRAISAEQVKAAFLALDEALAPFGQQQEGQG